MFAALGIKETADFVNAKVNKFIALAPIVYLANSVSAFLNRVASDNILKEGAKLFGIDEWLPGSCSQTSAQSDFQHFVCATAPILCNFLLGIADWDPKYDNQKLMPLFAQHLPSGTSLRTLLHYAQFLTQKDKHRPVFRMYDFGERENQKRYGQKAAPVYDLSLINIPVRGFVGLDDNLGDPTDNSILRASLDAMGRNYKDYIYDHVGHMTFMWALDPSLMFKDIMAEIASA